MTDIQALKRVADELRDKGIAASLQSKIMPSPTAAVDAEFYQTAGRIMRDAAVEIEELRSTRGSP